MNDLAACFDRVRARIDAAERRFGRTPGAVRLLAVSKTRPAETVRRALALGQRAFGENYLQEALGKIDALRGEPLEWHFIGALQANKSRAAAEHFSWVHGVERLKIAQRLSAQRPPHLPPLNVCLQVNLSDEPGKAGVAPERLAELAEQTAALPRLRLRGLMTLPAPCSGADFDRQRRPFRRLRALLEELNALPGVVRCGALETLSMGMSDDLEAAIAEGATLVRVGTALFGPRPTR